MRVDGITVSAGRGLPCQANAKVSTSGALLVAKHWILDHLLHCRLWVAQTNYREFSVRRMSSSTTDLESAALAIALGLGSPAQSLRYQPHPAVGGRRAVVVKASGQAPTASSSNAVDAAILRAVEGAIVSGPASAWPLISKSLGVDASETPSARALARVAPELPAKLDQATTIASSSGQQSSYAQCLRSDAPTGRVAAEWLRDEEDLWGDMFARAFGAASGAAATVALRYRPLIGVFRGEGQAVSPPDEESAEAVARATSEVLASLLSDADVILQVRDAVREKLRLRHASARGAAVAGSSSARGNHPDGGGGGQATEPSQRGRPQHENGDDEGRSGGSAGGRGGGADAIAQTPPTADAAPPGGWHEADAYDDTFDDHLDETFGSAAMGVASRQAEGSGERASALDLLRG